MKNRQGLIKNIKSLSILLILIIFTFGACGEEKVKTHDLEGAWRGWGGVEMKRDSANTYTGIYKKKSGTDVGRILLDMTPNLDGEYTGKWWEGETRIGKLNFKVSEDGRAIRGTWCALDSSKINPGKPSCEEPKTFSLTRKK